MFSTILQTDGCVLLWKLSGEREARPIIIIYEERKGGEKVGAALTPDVLHILLQKAAAALLTSFF